MSGVVYSGAGVLKGFVAGAPYAASVSSAVSTTITSTTSKTVFSNATIPINSSLLVAGSVFQFYLRGNFFSSGGPPPGLNIGVDIGGVTVYSSNAIGQLVSGGTSKWNWSGEIQVSTLGSSGKAIGGAIAQFITGVTTGGATFDICDMDTGTGGATINWTGNPNMTFWVTPGGSSQTFQCELVVVQQLL